MATTQARPTARDEWLVQLFSAKCAAQGGVVRRKLTDIDQICGRDLFLGEVRRRGYKAVINGGQMVVFCNSEAIQLAN